MSNVSQLLAAADAARRAGNLAEAEQFCRQALDQDPRQDAAWHMLGALAIGAGQPQAAIEHIHRAMKLTGPRSASYNNLGLAYQAGGDLPAAVLSFRQALALDPEFAEAHNNLGAVYLKQQLRLAEAARHLQTALTLRPTLAAAASNLERARRAAEAATADAAAAAFLVFQRNRSMYPAMPRKPMPRYQLGNQHRSQGRLLQAARRHVASPGLAGGSFRRAGRSRSGVAATRPAGRGRTGS